MGITIKGDRPYKEQLDESLPLYIFTCDDNLLSSELDILVVPYHAKNDRAAIKWSQMTAKREGMKAWTVTDGNGDLVYRMDYNNISNNFDRRKSN